MKPSVHQISAVYEVGAMFRDAVLKSPKLIHLHNNGAISVSAVPPTREEVIQGTMQTLHVVCGPRGQEGTPYYPSREEAELMVGPLYGLELEPVA